MTYHMSQHVIKIDSQELNVSEMSRSIPRATCVW